MIGPSFDVLDYNRIGVRSSSFWAPPGSETEKTADADFLGDLDGVVNLDAEVANGALDLGVPERS